MIMMLATFAIEAYVGAGFLGHENVLNHIVMPSVVDLVIMSILAAHGIAMTPFPLWVVRCRYRRAGHPYRYPAGI
jgi:hypothetical protein